MGNESLMHTLYDTFRHRYEFHRVKSPVESLFQRRVDTQPRDFPLPVNSFLRPTGEALSFLGQ